MRTCTLPLAAALISITMGASFAKACGFEEAPVDCGLTPEGNARYMLSRVVAGIKNDTPKTLQQIQSGDNGFRTQDTYVFCIGPDGVMSAHPSPSLRGHDVQLVHDEVGKYFFAAMMKMAKPGKIANIRYFARISGSNILVSKTSYYTRVADQVCGVDVYDGDNSVPPKPPSSWEQMAQIRARLTASMPEKLNADWAEFQRLYDEQVEAEASVMANAREQLQAVTTNLTMPKANHHKAPS